VSRSGSFAYMEVGKGREHDCMDAGGRAPKVGALGDAWSSCRGAEASPKAPTLVQVAESTSAKYVF